MRLRSWLLAGTGCALSLGSAQTLGAQVREACTARVLSGAAVANGWAAYRKNDVAVAASEFNRALVLCPGDAGALTGAGYVAMRRGRLTGARTYLEKALARDSMSYDAAAGAGMVAYRSGNVAAARRNFAKALLAVPGDSLARWYLAALPEDIGAVTLPPRVKAPEVAMTARTGQRVFEVRDSASGWRPMWIKAVNLGAALPGKHPSEFPPNDSTYERWIALMAGMGASSTAACPRCRAGPATSTPATTRGRPGDRTDCASSLYRRPPQAVTCRRV